MEGVDGVFLRRPHTAARHARVLATQNLIFSLPPPRLLPLPRARAQCFHNLSPHADIFNHSNVHFWEYSQVGYDALGFISCTGTNFLVRSAALAEVGGSPAYTLTEDFALGMSLNAAGWACRYVPQYLAVGEAPEEVRNTFQQVSGVRERKSRAQSARGVRASTTTPSFSLTLFPPRPYVPRKRSRWCKGHFQLFFSRFCPFFVRGLSPLHRVMYASGVWSYFVGAITAPFFMAIPMVTIWAGVFPIVVSWWAALAISVQVRAGGGGREGEAWMALALSHQKPPLAPPPPPPSSPSVRLHLPHPLLRAHAPPPGSPVVCQHLQLHHVVDVR